MTFLKHLAVSSLMLTIAQPICAQDPYPGGVNPYQQKTSENTQKVAEYLKNLGAYFGYDVTVAPKKTPPLLTQTSNNASPINSVWSYLGAFPVNTIFPNLKHFLPSNYDGAGIMNNTFANNTFKQYAQASPNQISVNPIIDQQPFQQDPVSQAVVNILSTPNYTFCLENYNSDQWDSKRCPNVLGITSANKTNFQVARNVIGKIPSPQEFFAFTQKDANVFAPLNSNTLISPLMYDTSAQSGGSASAGSSGTSNNADQGLTAQNQAEVAANFIRYASGMVAPLELPEWSEYNDMYTQAISGKNDKATNKAQGTIANYLAQLRAYSAQASVGMNNLYYILSKRMAQTAGNEQQTATSQAQSEYQMATWRLFNFEQKNNQQQTWKDSINAASNATVQKEIAILLAEINYQMYLSRQQQERLLLTNSMMQLLVAHMNKPNPSLKQAQQPKPF